MTTKKDLVIPEAFIIDDKYKKPLHKNKPEELIAPANPQVCEPQSPKGKDQAQDTVIIIDI
jgi:hypothetical protein